METRAEARSLRKIGSISAAWLVNHNLQSRTRISEPSTRLLSGIRRGTQRGVPSERGRTARGELHNEESSNPCLIIRLSSLNCFAALRLSFSLEHHLSVPKPETLLSLSLYLLFSAAKRVRTFVAILFGEACYHIDIIRSNL